MAVKGAILGDISGSQFEEYRSDNPLTCELFDKYSRYTDDTVTTLAIKYAIDEDVPFELALKVICRKYPDCGFGGKFYRWVFSNHIEPYKSWGNGSAMRVSYIGEYYENLEDVKTKAAESAAVTHNDPEGIKGAVVTATCIWMAKHGKSKDDIYNYVLSEYPTEDYKYSIEMDMSALEKDYEWDVSCQGSVPVAMRCFYESDSYESFLRNVYRLDSDADTLACIGGGVAEEYYHGTGLDDDKLLKEYLSDELWSILFSNK